MRQSTYDRLSQYSYYGKAVFRIWVEGGVSPMIEHPQEGRSGFFCPHKFSAGLDKKAFDKLCDDHLLEEDEWIRTSILDHVRGDGAWLKGEGLHDKRVRAQKELRAWWDTQDDGESGDLFVSTPSHPLRSDAPRSTIKRRDPIYSSPWIVTYGRLDYVIHRIARLLSRDAEARIHMTVIQPNTDHGKIFEKFAKSAPHLQLLKTLSPWGSSERKLLNEACGFAERSGEVLFYGRVFEDSVKEDFLWTNQSKPFSLPGWFWRGQPTLRSGPNATRSWMDDLCWAPGDAKASYSLISKVLESGRRDLVGREVVSVEHDRGGERW